MKISRRRNSLPLLRNVRVVLRVGSPRGKNHQTPDLVKLSSARCNKKPIGIPIQNDINLFIVITGYPDSEVMKRAIAHCPFMVMDKPFTVDDILDTVERFVEGVATTKRA